ncbi:RDD family protein [Marisediminicola sp. LYQ134]|uniref:RDD family protein n=1 Tax=unclassified Marisediminicola TaxID=2618316 RepID=UPI003983CC44
MAQLPEFEPDYETDDELVTGEAVALDLRPASFVLRAAGAMIDFLLVVVLGIGGVLLLTSPLVSGSLDDAAVAAISVALFVFVTIVVPTAIETLTRGKSLGKLAVGARIVRDDGGAIGFRHAFIRALTGSLEIITTLGGLAAVVGLLNSRTKRIGDILAGTYSQHERVSSAVEPEFSVPTELEAWAETADVRRLPDRLSRRIAQFLVGAPGMTATARMRVADELAVEATPFVSSVPDIHPEAFLLAVTAIRRDRDSAALALERARLDQLDPVLTGMPHRFPDRD